ncbi:hypothetical protein LTR12_011247 [Friedmanniomyces endolithicus]|nr:hypothetical protein LTR12_011247 [Friedmanniomyces endolithicus]
MNSSTEHLAPAISQPPGHRWSASTAFTTVAAMTPDKDNSSWTAPPMPPIPTELDEEAWRRRSAERQSYTSQMTCGTMHTDSRATTADPEQATRPLSQTFSTSTREQQASRPPRRRYPQPDHDAYSDLHWDINPLNPRNWSKRKKWAHTLVAALVTFTITLASTIIAPASSFLTSALDTTAVIATLPLSVFLLGFAFGPFISWACSAIFGRKKIYIVSIIFFAILSLLSELVTTLPGLLIPRLLAGILAGSALTQGSTMIADMWRSKDRTEPLMFYSVAPLLGPVVGVVVGGYVRWSERDSWTRFVVVFASAGCLGAVGFVSETSRRSIMRRERRGLRVAVGEGDGLGSVVFAPLRMAFTRPAVLLLGLQSGYVLGTLYASFVALPRVFGAAYGFGIELQSLVFMGMVVGLGLGYVALVLHHGLVYGPRAKHWQAQRASETEKGRRMSIRVTQSGTTNNFSPTNVSPLVSKDSSTTLALSQQGSSPASKRMKTPPVVDEAKSACLAAAAANYLNGIDSNRDARIQPEQITLMLSTNPAYSDLCAALESHHLHFDAVQLAKVLVEALPAPRTSEGPITPQRAALVRPKSSYLSAAAVRSDEAATRSAPPSASRHVAFYVSPTDPQTQSATSTAPTEQHLYPALPASILLVASLFLIGWITREDIHWIVPCIGMAVFAFAALLTVASTELYTTDRFGESEGASAEDGVMVVRYLMSAGFTMAAVPIYESLGVGWGTSVFGFIGLVLGGAKG